MITHKQLSLADIFTDCQNKFDNDIVNELYLCVLHPNLIEYTADTKSQNANTKCVYYKYEFLELLENTINLDEIVPASFVSHFHAATGRPRRHLLYPMLKALLLQLIFSIPTTSLLIVFLKCFQELRNFCGIDVVPDASKFTRFKQDFLLDLQSMFDHLVDLTEPICQRINADKAAMVLFDTSGIEAWVTENNPQYANRIIRQLKAFKKAHNLDDSYDPYKAAYASMPPHAAANPAVQQMYINGHFCYAYKFGIVTNGLGIVRDISFYNKDFLNSHPEIIVGRMFYLYPEKNLRAYPGALRGTQEWDATYKIRVNVEKSINHFKDSFCVAGRKNQNEKTLHADLLLAGIAQLVTVMVADKIHKHRYIHSLKPLIA